MRKARQQSDSLLSLVLGPMERVRQFCLDCQGGDESFVASCEDSGCALFPERLCVRQNTIAHMAGSGEQRECLRAIRRFCLRCAGGRREVRTCGGDSRCFLWEYRFGVMPKTYARVSRRLHFSGSGAGSKQGA